MNDEPIESIPPEKPESVSNDEPAAIPSAPSSDETRPLEDAVQVAAAEADDQRQGSAPTAGEPVADEGQSAPRGLRGKIQIGSRRDKSDKTPKPSKPMVVGADKPIKSETAPPPAAPVPTPSVRDPLPPDLEAELAAALGDASLDEILVGDSSEQAPPTLELESRHQVSVMRIHGDDVFFTFGGRHEGVASLRQFPEPPALGTEMEVVVKAYNSEDGLYEVVIPGTSTRVDDWDDVIEGTIVEARITGANTGGLECKVGNLRGFIPSSQIAMFRVEDYAEYLDQKLLCVVSEVNPRRKNLVLSRRAVLEREKEEARQQLLESLEVGQTVEGIVRKMLDFGAFVDIGGVDGLIHISQLSWDRVSHPSEVLTDGQKVRVKVEKIDRQTGKIGLSYRDLLEHPWVNIEEKLSVDSIVKGTVSRVAKFGAFVKLAPGIEGLVHISELSHAHVPTVGSVVSEGQEVDVKVLSIDSEAQRIALSMKAVLPEPEPEQAGDASTDKSFDEKREAVAAKRQMPLKGGTDRESGGGQFGLKW